MRRRYFFIVLTIIWMAVIFAFSAQDGERSNRTSMAVGEAVGEVKHHDFNEWDTAKKNAYIEDVNKPIRKTAHFLEYAILGVLCLGSLYKTHETTFCKAAISLGICVIYSITDELHQLISIGRACKVTDILIDSSGALVGIVIGLALIYVVEVHAK